MSSVLRAVLESSFAWLGFASISLFIVEVGINWGEVIAASTSFNALTSAVYWVGNFSLAVKTLFLHVVSIHTFSEFGAPDLVIVAAVFNLGTFA